MMYIANNVATIVYCSESTIQHTKTNQGVRYKDWEHGLVWGGGNVESYKMHADSRSTESSLSAEVQQKSLIWLDWLIIFLKHPCMAIGSCDMS